MNKLDSPLGKIFNKGLDKNDKKEGLFKRLENIEGKIKNENEKEQNQSDKLDYIFKNFDTNFKNAGKNVLKKLAKDEKS